MKRDVVESRLHVKNKLKYHITMITIDIIGNKCTLGDETYWNAQSSPQKIHLSFSKTRDDIEMK